jgi:hypothetical protein
MKHVLPSLRTHSPLVCPTTHASRRMCGTGLFPWNHQRNSLIEFSQQVNPKHMPPYLNGLARRIATNGLKRTMDDLDAEAKRIKAGNPTLSGFEQWAVMAPTKRAAEAREPAVMKTACMALTMVRMCTVLHISHRNSEWAEPADTCSVLWDRQQHTQACTSGGACSACMHRGTLGAHVHAAIAAITSGVCTKEASMCRGRQACQCG